MSLYHKYRPQTFDELYGNETTIQALQKMLSDKTTCPHAFLLTGQTGCGKTTIGRIIAKELECSGMDFVELDSAEFRGIDTIREIRKQAQFRPIQSSCRVWLVDECHKLTGDAQNAFLKILEDTPPHVYFILCTTDPQNLLTTIKGRCSQFQVNPLNEKQMFRLLRKIVKQEQDELEQEIYDQIIQDSFCYPRNAIQILEQVLQSEPDQRLTIAQKQAEKLSQSIELCRALIDRSGWKKVSNILNGLKEEEAERIRRAVLGYCQSVLLKGENDQAGIILEQFIDPFYNSGFPGLVFACYSVVKS